MYQKIHPSTGTNKDREAKKHLQCQILQKVLFDYVYIPRDAHEVKKKKKESLNSPMVGKLL